MTLDWRAAKILLRSREEGWVARSDSVIERQVAATASAFGDLRRLLVVYCGGQHDAGHAGTTPAGFLISVL